jgi:hypothetical protein
MTRAKDGPFQAEVLLPVQFLDSAHELARRQKGECQLLAAVLAEAIDCFQKNLGASDPRKQKLGQEAERWIMRKGDRFVFSFEHICDVLGFAPGYLRSGLERWRRAQDIPADIARSESVAAQMGPLAGHHQRIAVLCSSETTEHTQASVCDRRSTPRRLAAQRSFRPPPPAPPDMLP